MASLTEILNNIQNQNEINRTTRDNNDMEPVGVNDEMEIETVGVNEEITKLSRGAGDDFFVRARAYARAPKRTRVERFENMKEVFHKNANKPDWKDKELTDLRIFRLQKLSNREIVRLGRITFRKIHAGVSKRAVANLLLLAYNLKNDAGYFIINDYEPDLVDVTGLINTDEVNDDLILEGRARDIEIAEVVVNDPDVKRRQYFRRAAGYCYLAASYLRLFTKDEGNYSKIGKFLKDKFENFFSFSFPFDDHHPELAIIKAIKKQFEIEQSFKNTLYVILYASCQNAENDNLKSFLYKLHLNYTGLHPYMLFFQCMDILKLTNKELSNLLWSPMFQPQILAISEMVNLDYSTDPNYQLKMWKFARIFDNTFMSVLQTKNCVTFALVLAFIILETTKTSKKGPMGIAHLQGATLGERRMAFGIASRIIILAKREVIGEELLGAEDLRV